MLVSHQHSALLTSRNLLSERKRSPLLHQQSSVGDGKILENTGNHKLKSEQRRQVRKSGSNKKKSNLAASGDTQQSVGIFSTAGFHLMHFCQYNYD